MNDPEYGWMDNGSVAYNKIHGSRRWTWFVLIAGVMLPIITIGVELTTRMCSSIFFDPIPTVWHAILLGLVPLANAVTIFVWRRGITRYLTLLVFLAGMSIGVELFYSIEFIPLAPFSAIGILMMGIGLCGLSPFFAFASSIVCGNRLKDLYPEQSRKRAAALWGGIVVGLVFLSAFVFSSYMTYTGLRMAASADEATSLRGVHMIRTFGNKSTLLRACYGLPSGFLTGDLFWRDDQQIDRENARTTYYRVTGNSFNTVPPPKMFGARGQMVSDFDWDSDVGGTAVNGVVRSLSLSSSCMDSLVETDSLASYTEWTMVFSNSSSSQREARAEIALPPGGVVSRLTLWVNGEEREAAFSSTGNVRQAYQEVAVVQRHDPVLVTTCGPDRVLMQCFPVPADGNMKVRIGITSPLTPDGHSKATQVLPYFVEKNFGIADGVKHSVLVQGKTQVRKLISDHDLTGPQGTSEYECSTHAGSVWTPDRLDPKHYAIVQKLSEENVKAPKNVIILIDGSRKMASYTSEIANAISSLPKSCRFTVIEAGDEVSELVPLQSASSNALESAQRNIRHIACVGGIDNRPALLAAHDVASKNHDSVILWIHGPQPLSSSQATEQILQLWQRPGAPEIISVTAIDGWNSIFSDLEKTGAVSQLPRTESVENDLRRLFDQWADGKRSMIVRRRVALRDVVGKCGSSHIARLWACNEVARVCRMGDSRRLIDISKFAALYQIVTPVSGAVVLENEQQYKDAGLKAVDPSSVPSSVPEPATWMALTAGILALAVGRRKLRPKDC
ncbi:MAG: VIT domain-containing protein [Armatimonadota bacterium]